METNDLEKQIEKILWPTGIKPGPIEISVTSGIQPYGILNTLPYSMVEKGLVALCEAYAAEKVGEALERIHYMTEIPESRWESVKQSIIDGVTKEAEDEV